MGLKHLEKPRHVFGGLFRRLLEIELVTACAERRGRSVFEALDGFGFLVVQVNEIFAQNPPNAVEAAVDLFDALVPARFLNDAGDAGVDHGGRPARLGDQEVANIFCHKFLTRQRAKADGAAACLTSTSVKKRGRTLPIEAATVKGEKTGGQQSSRSGKSMRLRMLVGTLRRRRLATGHCIGPE